MLTVTDIEKINSLLKRKQTFAMAMLPGESVPMWFEAGNTSFDISPWLGKFADRLRINGSEPHAHATATMGVEQHSTTTEEYLTGVEGVISSCTERGGKTVYSRVITGKARLSWGEATDRLFTLHPSTFRYIFYTPTTLGWMGATPEILLDFNRHTGEFHTVALAGTRLRGSSAPWDTKNIKENRFVARHIMERLAATGAEAYDSPLGNVAFGHIEHLCSHITGTALPGESPEALIDAINPTPALCGWPTADAIADISRFEKHRRNCYGGFVAVDDGERYRAFVNLRCVHFSEQNYCVYGGGGIVADSIPTEEFAETGAKTSALCQILENLSE